MSSINLFQIMGLDGLSESSFFETRKQSMPWMKHGSKDTHFRWKINWRLELLGALPIMSETASLSWTKNNVLKCFSFWVRCFLTPETSMPIKLNYKYVCRLQLGAEMYIVTIYEIFCIGNHIISSAIWYRWPRADFSNTNKISRA